MTPQTLYAVLIALDGDTLLLPRSAVAEVVPRDTPLLPREGAEEGYLGDVEWSGRPVPLIQFEYLLGRRLQTPGRRARIVILHALSSGGSGRHLALVAQGYPHLVTLNEAALRPEPLGEADAERWVLGRCRVASQRVLIPDLAAIDAILPGRS